MIEDIYFCSMIPHPHWNIADLLIQRVHSSAPATPKDLAIYSRMEAAVLLCLSFSNFNIQPDCNN